jgi:hypothetical protein
MTHWTMDDRSALGQWLKGDLGRKFLQRLAEGRPDIPDSTDLTGLAIAGAVMRGYDLSMKEIENLGRPPITGLASVEHVDTVTD